MRIFSNEYIDNYNKRKLELAERNENLKEQLAIAKKELTNNNTPENELDIMLIETEILSNENLLNNLTEAIKIYEDNLKNYINKKSDENEFNYIHNNTSEENLKYLQLLELEDEDNEENYSEKDIKEFEERKKIREEIKKTGRFELSLINKITTQQTSDEGITPNNINAYIDAIKNIVENVLGLTPEEYDAVYNTAFNKKHGLEHILRNLAEAAPLSIVQKTLFDNKATIFALCWQDTYEDIFPKYTAMSVFNAKGEVKGNLIRAGVPRDISEDGSGQKVITKTGKISTAKTETKKKKANHGVEVDKICYHAMEQILPIYNMSLPDMFAVLANPKKTGFSNFGITKIIEARECYPSLLDFYMWNSPHDFQWEHFDDYIKAREDAHLPHLAIIDAFKDAYNFYKNKMLDIER